METITAADFRIISFKFRGISSELLRSGSDEEASRNLNRFLDYIRETPIIYDFIEKNNQTLHDIQESFNKIHGTRHFNIPYKDQEQIAFIYQLLDYIDKNYSHWTGFAMWYGISGGGKISGIISGFNNKVTRLLVNHISTYLEEMAIKMGVNDNPKAPVLIQGNVGQFNYAQGNIEAIQNNNNSQSNDVLNLTKELIKILKETDEVDGDIKDEAIDNLEDLAEEVESNDKPKEKTIRRITKTLRDLNELAQEGGSLALKVAGLAALII
ncbi:MAG: hypothetical protein ABS938_17810 [Psychrobacillus psychrodurans]